MLLWPLEALAALFAVAAQRIEDDGIGFGGGPYLIHLDGLAFELFVILKEAPQHEQAMRRHLRGLVVRVEFRIFGGDGNDLMVLLAGVDHRHQPNRAGMNDGERHYWL